MLLLQLVRLLSSVLCTMYRPQFSLVYTSIVVTLYLFVVSLMLIRLTMLMIESLRVGILCFLVLPLSRGNQRNNISLIVLLSKLSTRLQFMVLLKFFGFVLYFQSFTFFFFLQLHYDVITWVLLIYRSIMFFMLTLSMLRLTMLRGRIIGNTMLNLRTQI